MDEKIEELVKGYFGHLYSVRTPRGIEPSGFDLYVPTDEGYINLICLFGIGFIIYLDKNKNELKREELSEEDCNKIFEIIKNTSTEV